MLQKYQYLSLKTNVCNRKIKSIIHYCIILLYYIEIYWQNNSVIRKVFDMTTIYDIIVIIITRETRIRLFFYTFYILTHTYTNYNIYHSQHVTSAALLQAFFSFWQFSFNY